MSLSANLRVALFLFAGSCFTLSTHAAAVSQDQAELAAAMLMNSAGFSAAGPVRTVGMAPLGDGTPALWLVQFPSESFVWLRNEDGLPPVAGWGLAAGSELPDGIGLSDWLELQRLDVSHARQEGWQHPDARDTWSRLLAGESPSRDGQNVDPMLACLWNQGWPWNQYCPEDPDGPGDHVWAGCVATAMAQIMYFWQWPELGAGSHSYVHPVYGLQSANFGATSYDWSTMQDLNATPAAALLQYHCGVAVQMDYAPSGSGAWVGTGQHSALDAFKDFFCYPASASFIEHTNFSDADWTARIAEEITSGRPVLHRGYGSGGHAFVLDGLQGLDLFHVNWGWSGAWNGWYSLSALSPGGADFSLLQGAIVNLARPTEPVITIPEQLTTAGGSFAPLLLDDHVQDAEDPDELLVWWVEDEGPFSVSIDYTSRTAHTSYPEGFTGSGEVRFCVIDLTGLWTCATVLFTVGGTQAAIPAAVNDLQVSIDNGVIHLSWSAPESDVSGQLPIQVDGYQVHQGDTAGFSINAASFVTQLPAGTTTWSSSLPENEDARFYRVIVEGH